MPEFYIVVAGKIFFQILGGGGARGARAPPAPVSYAYEVDGMIDNIRWGQAVHSAESLHR